ncbi:hypothetical protein QE152_g40731 [Popillia japonica]|uniref:Zinc finger PHD-type domain-containing protein n=1 Tax=Popillia japonica TaxID=7064 RepID=A0AAW1HFH0_POPJA
MGWKKASKQFNLPKSTLRRLSQMKYGSPEEAARVVRGRPTILGKDIEKELVQYCLAMESRESVIFDPNQPSTSEGQCVPLRPPALDDSEGSSSITKSPFDIAPIPKIKKRNSTRGRKACSSTIITSSPYKAQLMEAKKAKEAKEAEKLARTKEAKEAEKLARSNARGCKTNRGRGGRSAAPSRKGKEAVKKRLNFDKTAEEESSDEVSSVSSGSSVMEPLLGVTPSKNDDASCMFCDRKFSEDSKGELWIMCIMCSQWAHVDCSGAEKDIYVCDFCQ